MMILDVAWMMVAVLIVCLSIARAETYGNFNTMGVVADCPEGYSPLDELRAAPVIMPMPRFGRNAFGKHLISNDPGFVSPEGGDYRLRPDSPCIDAGVVIPGINDGRFTGDAPDIGALEQAETPQSEP